MPAPKWPPPIHTHAASGRDYVLYRGVQYYLGPAGSPESRRAYADLLVRLQAGGQATEKATAKGDKGKPSPSLTVGEVWLRWLADEAPRYGGSHESVCIGYAFAVAIEIHARTPAAEFDALALEEVRDRMVGRGWAMSTVSYSIVRIRTVWRWAERRRLVPRGSWEGLRALPPLAPNDARFRPRKKRRAYSWEEVERVLACCVPPLAAALAFHWWTGCRSQDVRRLRVGQIDQSGEVWIYRPPQHKGSWRGAERAVFIGPRAQEGLAPWLADKGPEDFAFPVTRATRRSKRTDWYHGAHCYGRKTYGQAVSRAARLAGVPDFQAYCLRHSAKRRVTREMGLHAARAFLGQESISTTDGYDHHRDIEVATEVARRCG